MYDPEELLPPPHPAPHTRTTPVWVVAALTVASLGVALGAAVPRGGAGAAPPLPPRAAARPPVQPAPAAPADWMDLGPGEPGRSYAPVGGPTAADEPVLAPAPSIPVGAERTSISRVGEAPADAAPAPASLVKEPPPARRSPAASIPASRAAKLPLLAVRRGSGRIVFHEIASGGTAGVELEGEWAVVGRCGQRLRLDLAQPAGITGAPRGVGVELSSGDWEAAVAVPSQGCAAARLLRPRRASAAERIRFAASAGSFAPDELQQVAATERTAWLVFVGRGRSRVVVALLRDGAWREVWSREEDAGQRIAAIHRRGGAWEALFVTMRDGIPGTLQRVRLAGGAALPDAPAPLGG